VVGEEIVVGGSETSGFARGPVYQVWDKNGNLLVSRFVLSTDFTEVRFSKIDINNDGVDEILVVGRETKGLQRGPAAHVFDAACLTNHLPCQFTLKVWIQRKAIPKNSQSCIEELLICSNGAGCANHIACTPNMLTVAFYTVILCWQQSAFTLSIRALNATSYCRAPIFSLFTLPLDFLEYRFPRAEFCPHSNPKLAGAGNKNVAFKGSYLWC
jgi:hypothetical protein